MWILQSSANSKIIFLVKEWVKMLKLALQSRPFLRSSSTSWVWISCCATLRQVCRVSLDSVLVRQLVFLEEGFLILWVNLRQYAAVLFSLDRVVNMVMNYVGKHWIITLANVTSHSNAGSGCFISWVVGQSTGCWCSHLGPCHHNMKFFKVSGFVSHDMRSAGLLADAMCLHSYPVPISCIWETLWQIKIFHLLADVAMKAQAWNLSRTEFCQSSNSRQVLFSVLVVLRVKIHIILKLAV